MSFQRTAANALASSTALRYEGLRRITTSKLAHKLQVLEHRALQRDRSSREMSYNTRSSFLSVAFC